MTWAKVDDGLYRHAKVANLGDEMLEAIGLWTLALSWASEQLTDGYVPNRQLVRLAGKPVTRLVAALVRVGLWERVGDGVQFHEFHRDARTGAKRNPTRDAVLLERETRRRVSAAGGRARHQTAQRDADGRYGPAVPPAAMPTARLDVDQPSEQPQPKPQDHLPLPVGPSLNGPTGSDLYPYGKNREPGYAGRRLLDQGLDPAIAGDRDTR
jgi:hypothetical protein